MAIPKRYALHKNAKIISNITKIQQVLPAPIKKFHVAGTSLFICQALKFGSSTKHLSERFIRLFLLMSVEKIKE